ncbi:putative permease [Granulicella aggregans]|uniref:Putative permease n=1 Tax=Granulicella aggregans TaxID=474949 RepID=A0A7W8E2Y9_9BACT|nr:ABC transporter permease [Granulicella aggregans]MBB5056881.1 putative permease [Granulicella aggregans]
MMTILRNLMQDVRYAVRQLQRAPVFAATAILTLGLAIGVSTSVFSVLDATIVRPLPYHDPDGIVSLRTTSDGYGQPASWMQYLDWRRNNATLSALAGWEVASANLETAGGADPVHAVYTTDNFFDVFQVKPLLGRTFETGEEQAGRNDVVVLSYEIWKQRFEGRQDAIGKTIRVDGKVNTIVGVMPAGFRYPLQTVNAIYRPFHLPTTRTSGRGEHFLPTVGRLKRGVSLEQAQADMTRVFKDLGRQYPDESANTVQVRSLAEATLGKTAAPLRVLTLAVLGVLLIGCVNLAGLLLARGVRRQREFGLRAAVGAGRARLARQLLTESAILSLIGAGAGVLVAAALLQAMRQLLIVSLARGADVQLNLPVLAATIAIALVTGIAAGVLPALRSSRVAPSLALRSGGSAGTSRGQNRLRSGMITLQVAVALGLLVCSGLLLRNLQALRSAELGFDPAKLMSEELFVTTANYQGRNLLTSFYQPLLDKVRQIPGVTSAGLINILPILESGNNSDITIVGHPPPPPHQELLAENRIVMPGALAAIGAHLVKGRWLDTSTDRQGGALAANVNEAFLRKFFAPGEEAVGRQIQWGPMKVNIVGVASDLRQNLSEPPLAEMDILAAQVPPEYVEQTLADMQLVIRTSLAPEAIAGPLRDALRSVDATVPFREPQTMHEVIAETLTFERLESWLFGIFAALALVLSLVGIYGMVHHEVEVRTREIGVRMALGSSRGRVVRNILTRVAVLMSAGVAVGWVLTLALRGVIASVVELNAAHDAFLLGALTLGLVAIGMLASVVPARNAASIDPMEALRNE